MSIFDQAVSLRPMKYDWAFDYFRTHEQMHWTVEEIPLHEDIKDWRLRMTPDEINLCTQILRFFTQGDVDVAQAYYDKLIPNFRRPELRMMMGSFANREGTHIDGYSMLIETLGMPEVEHLAFLNIPAMADKHNYMEQFDITDVRSVAKAIAAYNGFTEGLQLFSSFAMLLNFQRFGKMKQMCTVVEWSIKDESLHVEAMLKLFRTIIQENYHVWTDDFRAELYQIARDMVALEDNFIDVAFEMGGVQGITAEETKEYIRYIADRRLMQLGLKPNWEVEENPFPWIDYLINAVSHDNFFEKRSVEYSKGGIKGNWADVVY